METKKIKLAMAKNETPFEKKSCYDCGYLKSALSWWCGNKEAIKARGTSLPGCIHCPYWKPDWKMIDDEYKTPENGYTKSVRARGWVKILKAIGL